jgi:hypothetical protein
MAGRRLSYGKNNPFRWGKIRSGGVTGRWAIIDHDGKRPGPWASRQTPHLRDANHRLRRWCMMLMPAAIPFGHVDTPVCAKARGASGWPRRSTKALHVRTPKFGPTLHGPGRVNVATPDIVVIA